MAFLALTPFSQIESINQFKSEENENIPTRTEIKISETFVEDLPDEIWLYIFSFLKIVSLPHLSLVCKKWKKVSSHESLWKVKELKELKEYFNTHFPSVDLIDENSWEAHIDFKKYQLEMQGKKVICVKNLFKEIKHIFSVFKSDQAFKTDAPLKISLIKIPKGLSFNKFIDFSSKLKEKGAPFFHWWSQVEAQLGKEETEEVKIIAITTSILKNSRGLSPKEQAVFIDKCGGMMPHFLHLVAQFTLTYLNSNPNSANFLHAYEDKIYCRSKKQGDFNVIVGAFDSQNGFKVNDNPDKVDNIGVAAEFSLDS